MDRIDILVNNHGIWNDIPEPVDSMKLESWEKMLKTNLDSYFLLCKNVVPIMKKQKAGKIILLSSTAGQRGEAYHSHYAASKGAIISFTKSLSTELAVDNINVNAVAPGWVDTDMCTTVFAEEGKRETITESIPLKRIPSSEDIAGSVLFLASHLSNHITGEVINVNGGSVLCG